MTASPVVQWGPAPNQVLNLRTRFTCASHNIIYLIHCAECLRQGRWSSYVGETDQEDNNAHQRVTHHTSRFANPTHAHNYPLDAGFEGIVSERLEGIEPDHDHLLRDPYTPFNFVHRPEDRRYTFIEGGFDTISQRWGYEFIYTAQCGGFAYNPADFSGALNRA